MTDALALASVGSLLEGVAVMLSAMAIGSGATITWGVLEGKSTEEISRLAYLGTAAGFVLGVPLTLVAFVLVQRGS